MGGKHKSNSKLDRYIRSRGSYLPVNFANYQAPYKDNHVLCVLCDEPHDDIEFTVKKLDTKAEFVETIPDVHICGNCDSRVKDMLTYSKLHSTDIFSKAIEKKDVQKNSRIDMLLYDGRFSPDVYYNYMHLKSEYELDQEDAKFEFNDSYCYFCQGIVKETSASFMWVPCGNDPYTIDGGTVLTCASCIEEISERLPEKSISSFYGNTFTIKVCPTCEEPYYITNDEAKMREDFHGKQNTDFQCGPCAYKYLHTTISTRLFAADKTLHGKISRYKDDICDLCLEEFTVDLLTYPRDLLASHINKDEKIVCQWCECASIPAFAAIIVGETIYNFTQGVRDPNLFHVKKRKKSGRVLAVWGPLDYDKFEDLVDELMNSDSDQLTLKM